MERKQPAGRCGNAKKLARKVFFRKRQDRRENDLFFSGYSSEGIPEQLVDLKPFLVVFINQEDWKDSGLMRDIKGILPEVLTAVASYSVDRISGDEAARAGIDFLIRGDIYTGIEKVVSKFLPGGNAALVGRPDIVYSSPRENCFPEQYVSGNFDLGFNTSAEIIASQGCSKSCGYCAISEIRPFYFPPEILKREIDYLIRHSPKLQNIRVFIADMFADRKYALELLPILKKFAERYKIMFSFPADVESLTDTELLKICNTEYFKIDVGVQSFNEKALAACGRPHDIKKLDENLKRIKAMCPLARVCLLMIKGLPADSEALFFKSLDKAVSYGLGIMIYNLRIVPGTRFDTYWRQNGLDKEENFPYYAVDNDVLSRSDFTSITEMTRKIFFAMSILSASFVYKKYFFDTVKLLRKRNPHLYLARLFAEVWLRYPHIRKLYANYRKNMEGDGEISYYLENIGAKDFAVFSGGFLKLQAFLDRALRPGENI